jgi:hypothetical protein
MKKKDEKTTNEEGADEEKEKGEGGVLSDSVLDAFDNDTAPAIDPLLEEDPLLLPEDEEEEALDSGDYSIPDEW